MSPHALISGASIAGPTLAHQLHARGWRTTVLERAPQLREEGQNVELRGAAREVARRIGIEDAVLAAGTHEAGVRFVDDAGRELAALPAGDNDTDGLTAEAEILRGELGRLLYERTREHTDYRFGRRIRAVREQAESVSVTLDDGEVIDADVLVVAEGTRSHTRGLVFDDVRLDELGLYVAYLPVPRVADDDRWWTVYNTTGSRTSMLRPDNIGSTRAALAFLSAVRGLADLGRADQVAMLRRTFADAGWQTRRILDALDDAPYYFDAIAQVHAPTWSRGRTVLLGDAAWCAGPFGTGTSLAMVGAYVLAGELARHGEGAAPDHAGAFAAYERVLRPAATAAQTIRPSQLHGMNPGSRIGLSLQRTALRLVSFVVRSPLRPLFESLTRPPSDVVELPDYPAVGTARSSSLSGTGSHAIGSEWTP